MKAVGDELRALKQKLKQEAHPAWMGNFCSVLLWVLRGFHCFGLVRVTLNFPEIHQRIEATFKCLMQIYKPHSNLGLEVLGNGSV